MSGNAPSGPGLHRIPRSWFLGRSVAALAAVAVLFAESGLARGAPTLRVRGRCSFQKVRALHYVKAGKRHTVLTAVLRDLDTRTALSEVKVDVTVSCRKRPVLRRRSVTTEDGRLAVAVPQCPHGMRARFSVEGDADYVLDAASEFAIDTAKHDVLMEISAPREVSAEQPEFTVGVWARQEIRLDIESEPDADVDAKPSMSRIPVPGLLLRLIVAGSGRQWQAATGPDGRAFFSLKPAGLGKMGRIRLTVRSAATALLNGAEEHVELVLFTRPTVRLASRKQSGRADESVGLHGGVSDRDGPVDGGLTHIRWRGKTLAVVRTNSRGAFSAKVSLKGLPLGGVEFVAHFVPTRPWRKPAKSRPLKFTVLSAKPVPLVFYVTSGILTVLLTLLLFAMRSRPWERWARALKDRQKAKAKARPAGIRLSSSELRAYLGAGRFSLSGQVRAYPTGRPIASARVTVERTGEESGTVLFLATDLSGRFGPAELPAGAFVLRCARPGYLSVSRQVSVPHRGELDGVTVELVSIRRKVMERYLETVVTFLPRRRLLSVWTPQEVLDHVRGRWQKNAPGVAALTTMVERTFYSGFVPEPSAIEEADRLCATAASEWMGWQTK